MPMTSRERVTAALTFNNPDRPPRELWTDPYVKMFQQDDLLALATQFPPDVLDCPTSHYGKSNREQGTPSIVGNYTDEWGCIWSVGEAGVVGEVSGPPVADWEALKTYRPPYELLTGADFSAVEPFCAASDRFVLSSSTIRPFERMQFVRGTAALFMDMAYGLDEVLHLRDMIHEYHLQEVALWCETDVDGIVFMDDWGAQKNLLIAPAQWRELFKPLYADYCRLIHDADKFVFMHSDGDISAIYPDLIEIGVDALNSQLFCMDIEALADQYKGQITFWGEIDRQQVLAFGTPDDARAAVGRVRAALDDGTGGVIAQCVWGKGVPQANVEAVFAAWDEPLR
ncbi:uroporphyrinogen decarboxylase family protein [Chloroflexota bacterium]